MSVILGRNNIKEGGFPLFIVPGDFVCLAPRASIDIIVAGAHGGEECPNSSAVRQRQGETLAVIWLSPLLGFVRCGPLPFTPRGSWFLS